MAFTFTVEDGSGLPNANSYVSVEEADDIVSVNIHADQGWSVLSLDVKQKLLAWSSRYLDNHVRWYGDKAKEESGLRWPRCGVKDRDGVPLPETTVPVQLRVATASMATFLMNSDRSVESDTEGLTRLRADVVELEFLEGYRLPKVPSHISYLITGIGTVQSSGRRFGRIIR